MEQSPALYSSMMYLILCVEDETLHKKYKEKVRAHNAKLQTNVCEMDSGFDLLTPENVQCVNNKVNKINFGVKCRAEFGFGHYTNDEWRYIAENTVSFSKPFCIHPRSSLSKTPLRLANSTGIIDAGYRGPLIGMFDCVYGEDYVVNEGDRLIQICAADLRPIYVKLVKDVSELGEQTVRGENGFGSTGK